MRVVEVVEVGATGGVVVAIVAQLGDDCEVDFDDDD